MSVSDIILFREVGEDRFGDLRNTRSSAGVSVGAWVSSAVASIWPSSPALGDDREFEKWFKGMAETDTPTSSLWVCTSSFAVDKRVSIHPKAPSLYAYRRRRLYIFKFPRPP